MLCHLQKSLGDLAVQESSISFCSHSSFVQSWDFFLIVVGTLSSARWRLRAYPPAVKAPQFFSQILSVYTKNSWQLYFQFLRCTFVRLRSLSVLKSSKTWLSHEFRHSDKWLSLTLLLVMHCKEQTIQGCEMLMSFSSTIYPYSILMARDLSKWVWKVMWSSIPHKTVLFWVSGASTGPCHPHLVEDSWILWVLHSQK